MTKDEKNMLNKEITGIRYLNNLSEFTVSLSIHIKYPINPIVNKHKNIVFGVNILKAQLSLSCNSDLYIMTLE
jgi:hypothetical protein